MTQRRIGSARRREIQASLETKLSTSRGKGTHSSVLAWRIPGTGEPGGLPSMGSHRVRHDRSDLAAAAGERADREKWEWRDQVTGPEPEPAAARGSGGHDSQPLRVQLPSPRGVGQIRGEAAASETPFPWTRRTEARPRQKPPTRLKWQPHSAGKALNWTEDCVITQDLPSPALPLSFLTCKLRSGPLFWA
ncbi:bolA-like protein 2 isoform X2 [Bos indicus x Bos taurus]|uniref:bolA-like protein 2 isoform X2 n=1 Tax=Bos indicus x Bos taurus TaxID=30522 RepID=UPI000F7D5231|nr:bolA-like protein 2 isoform X2 [Bos indicus x Bos taurus]